MDGVQNEGGETGLWECAMSPRYGPAQIGGSHGLVYVDIAYVANGQPAQRLR